MKVKKVGETADLFTFEINKFGSGLEIIDTREYCFLVNYFNDIITIEDYSNGKYYEYPVVKDFEYTFKIYKRPKKILATNGVQGLRKFLNDTLFDCYIMNFFSTITGTKLEQA